ncbi:hypothetical protein EYF80_003392 [Liparis tanakae]|uniref:Uncharacterized protein n=1 Tax=Liparis tanakae TaxID=230148 RepID=A0A4Z2J8G2_9TELE|nr:hypothetical protein EYF80_003392 [Liparis tanakae]
MAAKGITNKATSKSANASDTMKYDNWLTSECHHDQQVAKHCHDDNNGEKDGQNNCLQRSQEFLLLLLLLLLLSSFFYLHSLKESRARLQEKITPKPEEQPDHVD